MGLQHNTPTAAVRGQEKLNNNWIAARLLGGSMLAVLQLCKASRIPAMRPRDRVSVCAFSAVEAKKIRGRCKEQRPTRRGGTCMQKMQKVRRKWATAHVFTPAASLSSDGPASKVYFG